MNEDEKFKKAKERVKEIKDFYGHLLVYVVVNIGIFLINYIVSPGTYWFYWVLIGWGIGLAVHWIQVFGIGKFLDKKWEEKKVKEIMKEMEDSEESQKEKE
ncbi:MAG TPA: 2TM domain-containing protein [Halanaerobiales bacterium]|nr:2TM domain-containing protein [Halanaerobiales bacterium]